MLDMTRRSPRPETASGLARGLGWFSIALGLAELVAPRAITRSLGLRGQEGLVQAYGVREIATGIGLLGTRQPAPWLWGRVGGDVLDLATLTAAGGSRRQREARGIAMAAVLGITVLDVLCAATLSGTPGRATSRGRMSTPRSYGYGGRRGFRDLPERMRGAARDARIPEDMRIPKLLRPYGS
ncbi:hypothetical protein RHODGE_RHODGE_00550 [Rhodoplanes serenus]|uniref:Cyclase dehydrase n=1 Tax=Rhodoplanes serenus TaxID=200615 RepID=A0A3S4CES3_9BRAD|nr:hypothetical protein [Rhodoplanes serenus]VCU07265.1 hypothetical protein RHODGE_RHODGE_00550 [Rhodoplanes serenus]